MEKSGGISFVSEKELKKERSSGEPTASGGHLSLHDQLAKTQQKEEECVGDQEECECEKNNYFHVL
jgi:hypothetical protein